MAHREAMQRAVGDLDTLALEQILDLGEAEPPLLAFARGEPEGDLLAMRRYERASTLFTSSRPVEDWPKLFGDAPAVAAISTGWVYSSLRG